MFPIPIPPPTSLSTRFLWVFPAHQAQALVSFIPQPRGTFKGTWAVLPLQEPILILLIEMHSQQSLTLKFLGQKVLVKLKKLDLVSPDEPDSSLSDSAVTHAPQVDSNNSPLHFILSFYHFSKFIFHWIIALQCHVSFCHTSMQVNYMYNTSLPLESPSHPLPVPLGCLGAPG